MRSEVKGITSVYKAPNWTLEVKNVFGSRYLLSWPWISSLYETRTKFTKALQRNLPSYVVIFNSHSVLSSSLIRRLPNAVSISNVLIKIAYAFCFPFTRATCSTPLISWFVASLRQLFGEVLKLWSFALFRFIHPRCAPSVLWPKVLSTGFWKTLNLFSSFGIRCRR